MDSLNMDSSNMDSSNMDSSNMDSNMDTDSSEIDSIDIDLDISWIKENERLQNMETNYFREPMKNIDLFFVYINPNMYIEKTIRQKQSLLVDSSNNCSRLSKENLLKLIQTNKKISKSNVIYKYKFIDVLLYNIDLEPEHIQNYSNNENIQESSSGFFKVLNILEDITISPSIFIFHKTNSIFFFFQEIETTKHRHTLKSILKKPIMVTENDTSVGSQKSTKKVRIDLDKNNIEYREHSHHKKKPANKTRKNIRIMNPIPPESIVFVSP